MFLNNMPTVRLSFSNRTWSLAAM
ncbi:hypothetical protein MED222_04850 [Vibrio sp. MED222]|nr:hypothetical protein MED222_04850 [Vibrio sp. MED222]